MLSPIYKYEIEVTIRDNQGNLVAQRYRQVDWQANLEVAGRYAIACAVDDVLAKV